ncbi:MAG: 1-acyl-sn-glycerol-3-phosphate acyltransferase [Myxococcales bacterium FL481]|nr:MAG: 1-acyl-sn-glycerol-3-phosphate acyltransferase [Myxococcales bacterium FL481]
MPATPPSSRHHLRAPDLSLVERICVAVCAWINLRPLPKRIQIQWQRWFGSAFVRGCVNELLHIEGLDIARRVPDDRGVLLCANHRSFFDLYIISTILVRNHVEFATRKLFPVRSNYFYESLVGLVINLIMGGGAMFPPMFRQKSRAELNKLSVDLIVDQLRTPKTLVGMHPEGTRGKGPDPYELMRAQPGVGRVALRSGATVLPVWINGPTNSLRSQVVANRRRPPRVDERIVVVFGEPVDLEALRAEEPRPVVDLRASRLILARIAELGERDRQLRQSFAGAPAHDVTPIR